MHNHAQLRKGYAIRCIYHNTEYIRILYKQGWYSAWPRLKLQYSTSTWKNIDPPLTVNRAARRCRCLRRRSTYLVAQRPVMGWIREGNSLLAPGWGLGSSSSKKIAAKYCCPGHFTLTAFRKAFNRENSWTFMWRTWPDVIYNFSIHYLVLKWLNFSCHTSTPVKHWFIRKITIHFQVSPGR